MSSNNGNGFVRLIISVESSLGTVRDHIEISEHAYNEFEKSVGGWGVTNLLVNGIKDMMTEQVRAVDFGMLADQARAEMELENEIAVGIQAVERLKASVRNKQTP